MSLNGCKYTEEKDNVTEAGSKTKWRCENYECEGRVQTFKDVPLRLSECVQELHAPSKLKA